jgi:hypothetical protein
MNPTDWITAIAAIVNALSVIVLVVITNRYATSTQAILEESRKAREAAERQATAAQANIEFLQRRLEEQTGLGRNTVQGAINTAIASIFYWRALPISDLSKASSLPSPEDLLPMNLSTVLEQARGISPFVGGLVSVGFDNLQLAKNEIERIKNVSAEVRTGYFDPRPGNADSYLAEALRKFQEAQETIERLR